MGRIMRTSWVQEINIFHKPKRSIEYRIGLVYPNSYSVGMSGLTVKLLYHLLNLHQNIHTERIFLPQEKNAVPTSLETNKPLSNFDVLAFTFQFELDYINSIKMLQKSNIPVLSQDRMNQNPLLIAGGPSISANPEPVLEIFDYIFLGEFETVSEDFLEGLMNSKYTDFPDVVSSLPGFYSSSNYSPSATAIITPDLNSVNYPTAQVRPIISRQPKKIGLDGFFLQVSRGCPHGCHFCLIRKVFKPHRERSFSLLKHIITAGKNKTQTNHFSLIGSSTADYSQIYDLIEFLIEKKIKFTLPSIRIDSGVELLNLLRHAGQRSLTIAPETGCDKSRFAIGKKITDDSIINFASRAANSNISNLKTYFILGLTSNPLDEAQDIINLINALKNKVPSIDYNLSVTPIVPKKPTKFGGIVVDYNAINAGLKFLKSNMKNNVNYKAFPTRWAIIQAILSIGGRDLLPVLIQVASQGGSYQSWKKNLKSDPVKFYNDLYQE
jgi:radical SAM superfamily enzyme YgiQ (UPF0313 family)